MSLTYQQARDEITSLIHTPWAQAHPTYVMLFDDRPGAKPDGNTPWARLTIRHNDGQNAALGNKLFGRQGLVTVQIFTPQGEGLLTADILAKLVSDALEGKSTVGGVWFRNVRMREVGGDGSFYQVNVIAEFDYNEVK